MQQQRDSGHVSEYNACTQHQPKQHGDVHRQYGDPHRQRSRHLYLDGRACRKYLHRQSVGEHNVYRYRYNERVYQHGSAKYFRQYHAHYQHFPIKYRNLFRKIRYPFGLGCQQLHLERRTSVPQLCRESHTHNELYSNRHCSERLYKFGPTIAFCKCYTHTYHNSEFISYLRQCFSNPDCKRGLDLLLEWWTRHGFFSDFSNSVYRIFCFCYCGEFLHKYSFAVCFSHRLTSAHHHTQ